MLLPPHGFVSVLQSVSQIYKSNFAVNILDRCYARRWNSMSLFHLAMPQIHDSFVPTLQNIQKLQNTYGTFDLAVKFAC